MADKNSTLEPVLRDEQTVRYFDNHVPDYSDTQSKHLPAAIENVIQRFGDERSSLVEVGGGTGSLLRILMDKTPLKDFGVLDVSRKSLQRCEGLGCSDTHLGSVCDAAFVEQIPKKYDFATVSFVLHHLIGRSRKESMLFARQAVENTLKLVKPGGHAIIFEPLFGPASAMTRVFYAKKLITTFTSKRVKLFSNANNIGEPVVSYLTHEEMLAMLESIEHCVLSETYLEEEEPTWIMRLAGIRRWMDGCFVLRKVASQPLADSA